MVELADTIDLGSIAEKRAGSSPVIGIADRQAWRTTRGHAKYPTK